MDRRTFLTISSLGFGGLMVPAWGRVIAAEALLSPLDVALKKALADTALQSAIDAGASYCDARIGRYLRQFVITREDKVQNVVNTESTGIGIRVIADGAWGFAATNDLSNKGVVGAARQATAIAKANAKTQTAPVQLAKTPGVGEVAWKTPIRKNAMEVPVKDKVDLLLGVNAAATRAGADFVNSMLFVVNEQKYFASTDGSYIDQDVHRIWAPMTVTAIDKASGKFRTREGLSAPMGMGFEYLDGSPLDGGGAGKVVSTTPAPTTCARTPSRRPSRRARSSRRRRSSPASTTWCWTRRTPGSRSTSRSAIRWSSTACWATKPISPAQASPRSTSSRKNSSTAATR